jgi:hypothetical protein
MDMYWLTPKIPWLFFTKEHFKIIAPVLIA